MAQFYTSAVTGYGVTVRGLCTYTESDVSTTNNTSKLTVGLKAYAPDGWRSIRYAKMTVTVNGSVVSTQTLSSAIEEGWDGTVIFADKALTITHNNNGEATVNISVEIGFGTTSANSTGSANFSLTTIARSSTLTSLSATSLTISGTSGNLTMKITSKGNFYHRIQYRFNGSGSWNNLNTSSLIHVDNGTSDSQNLSYTTILGGFPSASSGTLNLQLLTYSDSGGTTLVGSGYSTSVAISITIKPTVTVSTAITVNSSPISGYLIAGHSSVKAGFTTTKPSGAASVTTYYSIPSGYVGTLKTVSSTSTSAVNVVTNTLPSNTSSTSKKIKIQAYAVDSRGNASSTVETGELTVYPYNPPKITGNFFRCVSTSDKTADEAGAAATGMFSGAIGANASVNGQNSSISSATCKYSKNGGTATTFSSNGAVAIAETDVIVFTVTVTDKVTSVTATYTVPAALFPLDLYQNGSDMGVGLGTIAVKDRIVAGLPLVHPEGHRAVVNDYYVGAGSNGYVLLCTIAIKSGATYCDQPIIFEIANRGHQQNSIVCLTLATTNSGKTHAVNAFKASNYASILYVHTSAENVFQIYCKKVTTYDNIAVLDYNVGSYVQARADITWNGTFVSALPDGCVQASKMVWDLAENANSATTADSANVADHGKVIAVTPTAGQNYYLMFGTGTDGNRAFGVYAGACYRMLNGSTSAEGYMGIILGRGIKSGNANNGYGFLRIYGHGDKYYNIYPNSTANTDNVTLYMSNHTGTIAIRDAKVTGTLSNGSWITIAYPSGYTKDNCHVTGWDVDYNGNYRTGDGLENSATTSRVLISLESGGIKAYTGSSTYNGKTIRVFLSLNA